MKPGQRLVSVEGDLWRWDGFAVAANAPTGAARRLAGRRVVTLAVSDIISGRNDMIGSGPTLPDPATYQDALAVIAKYVASGILRTGSRASSA